MTTDLNQSIQQTNHSANSCQNLFDYLDKNSDLTMNPTVQAVFAVLYFITVFIAISMNTILILAICWHQYMWSVRSFFLISLFICDLLLALSNGIVNPIVIFAKEWILGDAGCRLLPIIQSVTVFNSSFVLTAIAFDRYIMIVRPDQQPLRAPHALSISVFLWALSLGLSLPPFFYQKLAPDPESNFCGLFCLEDWPDERYRSSYSVTAMCLQFFVPLMIILLCYAAIFMRLNRLMKNKLERCLLRESRRKAVVRQHQRTTLMLVAMVGVFIACWLPLNIFNVVKDLHLLPFFVQREAYFFGLIFYWVALSSSIWNPMLYAGLNEQIRESILDILPKVVIDGMHSITGVVEERPMADRIRARLGSLPINQAHEPMRVAVAKHVAALQEAPDSPSFDFSQQMNYLGSTNKKLSQPNMGGANLGSNLGSVEHLQIVMRKQSTILTSNGSQNTLKFVPNFQSHVLDNQRSQSVRLDARTSNIVSAEMNNQRRTRNKSFRFPQVTGPMHKLSQIFEPAEEVFL